jgi:hypothetical protein
LTTYSVAIDNEESTKKFFSYYPDDGFELHETEDEAKARAQYAIDMYRDDAMEGWAEEVDSVCWGELREYAKEIDTTAECGADSCDFRLATFAA